MKKQKKLTLHLYKVKWLDALADGGWKAIEQHRPELIEVQSVGWLVAESRNVLSLAQQLSSAGSAADTINIPKNCIVKKTKLGHSITYERQ